MTDQHTNTIAALAYCIDLAADDAGVPLKPGVAQRMASSMVKRLPKLLEAIAQSAERGAS